MYTFLRFLQIFPKKVGKKFRKLKKMGREAPLSLIRIGEKIICLGFGEAGWFFVVGKSFADSPTLH